MGFFGDGVAHFFFRVRQGVPFIEERRTMLYSGAARKGSACGGPYNAEQPDVSTRSDYYIIFTQLLKSARRLVG
jgi:hypothetical protein